ncbi:MAG: bifunctional D-glycero-beta-D-manno-heptose-7-phosphate kinase/D-glycero-beta-D-manno-heptose 1-phosphate adenylyltransferase HldE [Gammaproteobacteria bacterium]|nr:bifunctional D-glycero-beta-D-manno-heptose-7-phosphate kinase/D-glycero-beta-D-manno-heptose 1-phosphate adenylyltransferase HldE [Gammaproteobacteria bacterium]MDH5651860.1 bifunctional D-glycero-beta-D-manno-heptose-7-phosphate kinase/D-glycero-beta-D-manno-heptose 1-phosphate adenylyltransferase HldE [Gammaproteobacteria bacterium]
MKIELPRFEDARVLVLGDLMLDRYWHGDTSRISPEAPVPVVLVGVAEERAGGAGNVALNVSSLGGKATLLGLTGKDEACSALEKLMQTAGIGCHFQQLDNKPTVTKLRVLSRHQQLIRLDFEDGFSAEDQAGLREKFEQQLPGMGAVILSDYGKGTLTDIQQFIKPARAAGIPILVDPKGNDFEKYRGVTLITPNLAEFEAVVGPARSDEELVRKGMELIEKYDLTALLVTRSERGMTLLQRGKPPFHQPTRAREVFDVTGAGDTVISTLAAALAAGKSLPEATVISNLAAGVVVSKLGTATASVSELQAAIRAEQYVERGIMAEEQLVQIVKEARAHGERVVMTNGCFDILHPGHVTYLQQAKKLGDRLIIAVNDDPSVKRLKGPTRPINTCERRMMVLAALECVDWVVPFGEDTPERLICAVLPDILVKGGDYKPEDIAGGKCVLEHGGEVKVLDYVDGHSTTDIIRNILAT